MATMTTDRGTMEGVSELERTMREVRRTLAALAPALKMAGVLDVLAVVAHEIRTPTGRIDASSAVLFRALAETRNRLQGGGRLLEDGLLQNALAMLEDIGRVDAAASRQILRNVRSLPSFAREDGPSSEGRESNRS